MSSTDQPPGTKVAPSIVRDLRTNSFAAAVTLVIEFGLGIWTNLYANLPTSDHGKTDVRQPSAMRWPTARWA